MENSRSHAATKAQEKSEEAAAWPHDNVPSTTNNALVKSHKEARASPVLSLSSQEPMYKYEQTNNDEKEELSEYLTREFGKWCQTRTKEEIAEATALLMSKEGPEEAQTTKEEQATPEEQLDTQAVLKGDVRAYFTRGLSKILVQAANKEPAFVPGSKVMDLEVNPDVLQSPIKGQVHLLESFLKKNSPPKTSLFKTEGKRKRTSPGSQVLAVEEADRDDNALYAAAMSTMPKKRRLNFKQKLTPGENALSPKVAIMENEFSRSVPQVASKERKADRQDATTAPAKPPMAQLESEQIPEKEAVTAPVVKPPFRHALLGNACTPCDTNNDFSMPEFRHPQYCTDTKTDGVLSSIEMEFAWLCEESIYCLEGKDVCWSFVYEHASRALQVDLRKGKEMVRREIAEATRWKRENIRASMGRGYRRQVMGKTIAHHRLAIKQRITVEKLHERMRAQKKKAASVKKTPKASGTKMSASLPIKKRPTCTKDANPKGEAKTVKLEVRTSKVLTKLEEELAWLLEESILQNIFDDIDHKYVLANATPPLREAIKRHKRRYLPRLVRMQSEKVKAEFDLLRGRIRVLLYKGYRREETKAVLPVGVVTVAQFHEQQSVNES